MTSFNLDDVTRALEGTQLGKEESKGVSFEGKNLKLDTANDAKPLVDSIASCKHLEYLNLAGNTLGVAASEAVAQALETHPEFKRALWKDLFTGRLKDEIPKSLKFLGEGLVKADAKLTELDLSDNAFGPIGVKGLAALLKSSSCYNLKELRLNNNGLGISGGKLLASALMDCYNCSKKNGTPLTLNVFIAGRNRLENEGAKALAEVFKTIGTFEEIAMPQNGIYHPGITALSEAFAMNTNLEILNLNDNTIGPKGSISLAKALPNLKQLKLINLGDCLIRTKGALSIATALDGLNQLEELVLDYNEIKIEGGLALAKALVNKPNLKHLMLDGNNFGTEGRKELEKAMGPGTPVFKTLGTLDADETADEDEEEVDDNEEEEEDEQEEESDEEEQEVHVVADETIKECVTVTEFLEYPTAERFLALGENYVDELLKEAKSESLEDKFLEKYIPVLMKVCSLTGGNQSEASKRALECSNVLFSNLFEWVQLSEQSSLLNNALLVHLGLIKSEDKKYRPPWNVDSCLMAVEAARKQKYFLQSTKEALDVFIERKKSNNTDNLIK